MDRISSAVSGERRDAGRVRLRHRRSALKPARCQRRSVSGWTMRRTFLQVGVMAASATNAMRSNRVTRGLATERFSTVSWCRSKATSPSNAQRERRASTMAATSKRMGSHGAQGNADGPDFSRIREVAMTAADAPHHHAAGSDWAHLGSAGDHQIILRVTAIALGAAIDTGDHHPVDHLERTSMRWGQSSEPSCAACGPASSAWKVPSTGGTARTRR
jgi:hypothetical protein